MTDIQILTWRKRRIGEIRMNLQEENGCETKSFVKKSVDCKRQRTLLECVIVYWEIKDERTRGREREKYTKQKGGGNTTAKRKREGLMRTRHIQEKIDRICLALNNWFTQCGNRARAPYMNTIALTRWTCDGKDNHLSFITCSRNIRQLFAIDSFIHTLDDDKDI